MQKTSPLPSKVSTSPYINRDLSWLEFNLRVLEEAQDPTTPLIERLKFLAIVSSNLDEFMSVRVAGIHDQVKANYAKLDFSGYTPSGLLKKIMKNSSRIVENQYRTYRELLRLLSKEGVNFLSYDELHHAQKKSVDVYFHDILFPVLTPMAVDQSRPFPLVHSQSVYLAIVLRQADHGNEIQELTDTPINDELYFAILQIPSNLPRYIRLLTRKNSKKQEYILLDCIIKQHIDTLFSGYTPIDVHEFRMTRNADLSINEEGAEDLLEEIEKEIRKRRWGSPVRLEFQQGMHPFAFEILADEFDIKQSEFVIDGPLDLSFLMKFALHLKGFEHLRYPKLVPVYPREISDHHDIFSVLQQKDILLFHPYEPFDPVTDFIHQASVDPDVLAIKITLYRVSGDSALIRSLAHAAEMGKQVTVVVELKARFDEERNIAWARQLEKSGCHVIYGLIGLKTHAKITLVVRQEQESLRRYVHVGTGNYNDFTAQLYTDIGLFTSHPIIGEDASNLFNEMTGYSAPHDWKAFGVAPTALKDKLFALIDREVKHARENKPARVIAKMNSLSNQEMIDHLYLASQAGVKVDLIVRGICCLRPGVTGLSENITVRSVVDRFLEHSRIFYFENAAQPDIYISSADWMTRNLTRRIELMTPVFDKNLKEILTRILHNILRDNVKSRLLTAKGQYKRVLPNELPFRSQFALEDITIWKY